MKIPKKISDPQMITEVVGRLYDFELPKSLNELVEMYDGDVAIAVERSPNYDDPDDIIMVISRKRLETTTERDQRVAIWAEQQTRAKRTERELETKERAELARLMKKYGDKV
jgi:hypothetical protein